MLAALGASGCTSIDRTTCMAISTGVGAIAGGLAGGLSSYSEWKDIDNAGSKNWRVAGVTTAGFVLGGAAGWGLSNAICQEPEPPPPPPVRMAPPPPPPPPPPVTNRRGG
jgi:hypothetical protein